MSERQRVDLTEITKVKLTATTLEVEKLRGWLGVVFGDPDAEAGPVLLRTVEGADPPADPMFASTFDLG